MVNFEKRTGPDFGDDAPTYPDVPVAQWFRDAKLGFFIHWGLYSHPAWGTPKGDYNVPLEDAYTYHQYAEWYANTVRILGSPTQQHHAATYGPGSSYEDLADLWDVADFDATNLVGQLVGAGGQYIVPTTKHHDGFALWGTELSPFNSVNRGPRRDLIKEIVEATRTAGAKVGLYYSGALDWHVSEFPPIESDTDLFRFRRNDAEFSQYSAGQLTELIDNFSPDILWNDIEWPDGGKGHEDYALAAVLGRYFAKIPKGVINDRWGVPFHGYLTREYTHVPDILEQPWEATRGLGASFGYNQNEGPEHTLSSKELIHLLIDVVAKNGNLLLNVGPRADGSIPEIQQERLRELGAWLSVNGEAIYGTRPWVRHGEDYTAPQYSPVSYTRKHDVLYVHALEPGRGQVVLPAEVSARTPHVEWLSATGPITGGAPIHGVPEVREISSDEGEHALVVPIPEVLRGQVAAVARIQLSE